MLARLKYSNVITGSSFLGAILKVTFAVQPQNSQIDKIST